MGEVGKENEGEGWIIFFFLSLCTVHQMGLLRESGSCACLGEERKRVKSIPGRTSQLQSRPGECADRVCLRHSGASVVHPDKDGTGTT